MTESGDPPADDAARVPPHRHHPGRSQRRGIAARAIEQEREVAIFDLLEKNSFKLDGSEGRTLSPVLGLEENRLIFDVALEDGTAHARVALSLTPLRKVVKDYFLICESYYKAIRTAPPSQIEALDMGRRGLHNEGASELQKSGWKARSPPISTPRGGCSR